MRYAEQQPLASLAGIVECIWTLDGRAAPDATGDPVLPDGRPELILHLGDPFQRIDAAGAAMAQPAVIFAGQLPSRLLLRAVGRIAVIGVRFHPHGAAGLLRVPQHQLAGFPIGLDDVHAGLARELADIRDRCREPRAAVDAVQAALLRWIVPAALDPRVRFAVAAIARARGRVSIDRLADAANVTRRHLERRFLDQVGLAPKRLARIARFQHALQLLERSDPAWPGAHAAAACGYADQSHFIRDFRELAGCPPSAHLLRKGELTGFFIAASAETTPRDRPLPR